MFICSFAANPNAQSLELKSPDEQLTCDPIPETNNAPPTMKILLRLNPQLVQYIDFVTLLPYINKYEILTPTERQVLNNDGNQHKQVSNLLQYLENKKRETVDDFVRAISEEPDHSGHCELCKLLREQGITFI